MDSISHKRCAICKQIKPAADFNKDRWRKSGLSLYCRSYNRKRNYDGHLKKVASWFEEKPRWNRWASILLSSAKRRSKRDRWECDLTVDFILALYEHQNGLCPYFGVEILQYSIRKRDPLKASLDRIDSKLGYLRSNVILCCAGANWAKNGCDLDVFENFLRALRNATSR